MSYLVLARKYRPQTFDDLVGQDHVARTLASAIASGRVAHAFLFTGVRGVGKTTSARLLAKCLNCVGRDGRQTAPTATPCNQCAPCNEITAGQDLDVQEIDGASYNGVDEVRRLQEGMSFRPARDRFKIYIVDEVHMLSTAAWNAFLKTLEEPPPHVKFIFATTEVHKVPVTILSRCQRYDFKLIATQTIAKRLDRVLAEERIDAEVSAVQLLAREAAGSMRDAMSLLDQVIAFSGEKLTAEAVTRVLGVADRKILHELAGALVAGDAAGCLGVIDRLAAQGFDLASVTRDVLRHLRDLVVAKVCSARGAGDRATLHEMLDLADEEVADVVALASRSETDDLSRLFQGFSQAFDDIVRGGQPRLLLEMALVRLARRPPLLPVDEMLSRIGELERRLAATPPTGSVPRGGGGGGLSTGTVPRGVLADTESGRGPHLGASTTHLEGAHLEGTRASGRTVGSLALAQAPRAWAPEEPRPATVEIASIAPAARSVAASPRQAAAPSPSQAAGMDDWRAIIERVRLARPAVASVFEHAIPVDVNATRVVVSFGAGAEFIRGRATEPESLDLLTREARGHFGAATQVVVDAGGSVSAGARTVASVDAERRSGALAGARAAVQAHPVVQEAMRLFGAKVLDVKLPSSDG